MRVHILATCRRDDLLPYTLLVFRSLRIGFPTADVTVYLNSMNPDGDHSKAVVAAANSVGADTMAVDLIHHAWIEELLKNDKPFWILDTDLILYGNIEQFTFDSPMAGFRIPEFTDESSGAITRARLHTSLLYLDPKMIEVALLKYTAHLHYTPFTPHINLIYPVVLPFKHRAYFYDTCALLYHAVGGTAFADSIKEKFFHFHSGTISDLVMPRLKNGQAMLEARAKVLENPELGRGGWREQEQFWANRQPQL